MSDSSRTPGWRSAIILRAGSMDWIGEGPTLNSCRDWAKLFSSEEEAREYAGENRIYCDFTAETVAVPEGRIHGCLKDAVAPHHESAQTMAQPGTASGVSVQPGLFEETA